MQFWKISESMGALKYAVSWQSKTDGGNLFHSSRILSMKIFLKVIGVLLYLAFISMSTCVEIKKVLRVGVDGGACGCDEMVNDFVGVY